MFQGIVRIVNFSQAYYVIIDRVVSAPVYGIKILDVLNVTDKIFIFQFMATVHLPG